MNKTEIEYISARVSSVVKCTNGKISTRLEKKKKGTGLTDVAKIRQIRDGRATLRDDFEISRISRYLDGAKGLFLYFDFAVTEKQTEKIKHNERVDRAIDEMHTSVELAGERLVDKVVLGIIDKTALPQELEELARMFEREKQGEDKV